MPFLRDGVVGQLIGSAVFLALAAILLRAGQRRME
jgi:hypothetical protein